MASKYQYAKNPHLEVREQQGPATRANQHKRRSSPESGIHRFNGRLGLAITNRVGTMWAAYLFCILALVSLPGALATGNTVVIIAWVAQTFLQLVLLPIIIVGQNIQAKASDERAIATYNDADAILHDARQIQAHLDTQDEAISDLLDKVAALESKLLAAENKKK
jgi:hypothetical protein